MVQNSRAIHSLTYVRQNQQESFSLHYHLSFYRHPVSRSTNQHLSTVSYLQSHRCCLLRYLHLQLYCLTHLRSHLLRQHHLRLYCLTHLRSHLLRCLHLQLYYCLTHLWSYLLPLIHESGDQRSRRLFVPILASLSLATAYSNLLSESVQRSCWLFRKEKG